MSEGEQRVEREGSNEEVTFGERGSRVAVESRGSGEEWMFAFRGSKEVTFESRGVGEVTFEPRGSEEVTFEPRGSEEGMFKLCQIRGSWSMNKVVSLDSLKSGEVMSINAGKIEIGSKDKFVKIHDGSGEKLFFTVKLGSEEFVKIGVESRSGSGEDSEGVVNLGVAFRCGEGESEVLTNLTCVIIRCGESESKELTKFGIAPFRCGESECEFEELTNVGLGSGFRCGEGEGESEELTNVGLSGGVRCGEGAVDVLANLGSIVFRYGEGE